MRQTVTEWDATGVCTWLDSRIAAARANQVAAQRGGRDTQDECDAASAEELVCTAVRGKEANQAGLLEALKVLLDRDDHIWRSVHDDRRFDRHVRTYARKLARRVKTNEGFGKLLHHQ